MESGDRDGAPRAGARGPGPDRTGRRTKLASHVNDQAFPFHQKKKSLLELHDDPLSTLLCAAAVLPRQKLKTAMAVRLLVVRSDVLLLVSSGQWLGFS